MKTILTFIVTFFVINSSFGQSVDTLKVLVLSPNQIKVADNYLGEYNKLKKEVVDKRLKLKKQKTNDKNQNVEEYNRQPDYTKQMFENELSFYDSLKLTIIFLLL